MPESDRVLYFADFSGLHSQHAANHSLLHAVPGDLIGSVMITFRLGVGFVPLLLSLESPPLTGDWYEIAYFPQPDLIRNVKVRLNEVTSVNPFELETDGILHDISQWFPSVESATEGVD